MIKSVVSIRLEMQFYFFIGEETLNLVIIYYGAKITTGTYVHLQCHQICYKLQHSNLLQVTTLDTRNVLMLHRPES